jgi:hypothetical protein
MRVDDTFDQALLGDRREIVIDNEARSRLEILGERSGCPVKLTVGIYEDEAELAAGETLVNRVEHM